VKSLFCAEVKVSESTDGGVPTIARSTWNIDQALIATLYIFRSLPDGSVLIWNRDTAELVARLPSEHAPSCNTVAWSPVDPGLFVSGGDDFSWKMYVFLAHAFLTIS